MLCAATTLIKEAPMRLIECYIEGFGKLHGYHHSFGDGLNVICEDNGFGKTTLTVFIKVMLYGFDETKKHSIAENDRKHYLPWSGGVCGGWLIFSHGGVEYKVERTFGSRASEDTYTLYRTETGKVSNEFPSGLGEQIFGIDSDGFERTVFLSERRFSVKNDNKSVSAKLSDLVGFEWDVGALDDATDALDERRKYYQHKRGGGGHIGELRDEIAACESRIIEITRSSEELAACERELEEAKATLTVLEARRQDAIKRSTQGEAVRQYRQKAEELEAKRAQKRALTEQLGGKVPDEAELYYAERAAERAHLIEERLEGAARIRSRNGEIADELARAREYLKGIPVKVKRKAPVWIFLLTAIFGAAGALAVSLVTAVGIALIACALVSLAVGAVVLSRKSKEEISPAAVEFARTYGYTCTSPDECVRALSAIIAALEAEGAIIGRQCRELGELEDELARKRTEAQKPLEGISGLGERPYLTLRRLLSQHTQLEALISELERELDGYARTSGLDPSLVGTPSTDKEEHSDPRELDTEIHAQRVRIATLETRCNAHRDRLKEVDEVRDRRAELEEQKALAEEKVRLISLTREHLLGAKDSLTTKYLGKTRERFAHYLSLLSTEKPELFTLAVDFSITKDEAAKGRPEEAFSLGTRELYAIAARLALADSLYGEEAPPLILDDPFCHLDDNRCAAALAALKEVARERQIIYLCCSRSRTL